MECYMCPGAVTQKLYLFLGEYDASMKVSEGGGAQDETENIEVLEYPMEKALDLIKNGAIKDAKTLLLLQHLRLQNIL